MNFGGDGWIRGIKCSYLIDKVLGWSFVEAVKKRDSSSNRRAGAEMSSSIVVDMDGLLGDICEHGVMDGGP